MEAFRCAIIGGTGIGKLMQHEGFTYKDIGPVTTPDFEGIPTNQIWYGVLKGNSPKGVPLKIFVIDRHRATGQFRYPHQGLYPELYMWALMVREGLNVFLTTTAVGGIPTRFDWLMRVGSLFVPFDCIDYTQGVWTFAKMGVPEGHEHKVYRSVEKPVCSCMAQMLNRNEVVVGGLLASAVHGPRYEFTRQIWQLDQDGVDLMGMPCAVPEIVLAAEGGAHIVPFCVVTDIPGYEAKVVGTDVVDAMTQQQPFIKGLLFNLIVKLAESPPIWNCACTFRTSIFDEIPGWREIPA